MKITNLGGAVPGLIADMLNQPHVLIAGVTGSGKSTLIHGLICAILRDHPNRKQLILLDPKRVELAEYADMPHTLRHAITPEDILSALAYARALVEQRYKAMQRHRLRMYDGTDVYIIIEEFAELITSTVKKQVLSLVQSLCQIGRAARVHVIASTQYPLARILPTEIKVNFTAVCGLRVSTRQQSRVIIDMPGCEQLPQYGRCIYVSAQGAANFAVPYISDAERADIEHYYRRQCSFLYRLLHRAS